VSIPVVLLFVFIDRSHKSHELARNDPVKITILNFLIMFILLNIKSIKVVPSFLNSEFKSLKALQNGALIEALAL